MWLRMETDIEWNNPSTLEQIAHILTVEAENIETD